MRVSGAGPPSAHAAGRPPPPPRGRRRVVRPQNDERLAEAALALDHVQRDARPLERSSRVGDGRRPCDVGVARRDGRIPLTRRQRGSSTDRNAASPPSNGSTIVPTSVPQVADDAAASSSQRRRAARERRRRVAVGAVKRRKSRLRGRRRGAPRVRGGRRGRGGRTAGGMRSPPSRGTRGCGGGADEARGRGAPRRAAASPRRSNG